MNYSQNQLNQFKLFWNDVSSTGLQLEVDHPNNRIPYNKKGNKIHIKKKNEGKFTEAAERAGMGVQEFASHVLANKDKYNSKLVKRANFARNVKKFNHG